MAITQRSTSGTRKYYGLSSDTKATTSVPIGSTFYETDTGVTYLYTGSAWVIQYGGGIG